MSFDQAKNHLAAEHLYGIKRKFNHLYGIIIGFY